MDSPETQPNPRPAGPVRVHRVTVKPTLRALASSVVAGVRGINWDLKRFIRPQAAANQALNAEEPNAEEPNAAQSNAAQSNAAQPNDMAPNAMSHAPLEVRKTGEVYVFDATGLHLEGSRELELALRWDELSRLALQVQRSEMLGLKLLRLVLWPTDPDAFVAGNRGVEATWVPELGAFALAVATGPSIPERSVQLMVTGLAHAGALFNGQVDEVGTGR